jgi:hypothetical protein
MCHGSALCNCPVYLSCHRKPRAPPCSNTDVMTSAVVAQTAHHVWAFLRALEAANAHAVAGGAPIASWAAGVSRCRVVIVIPSGAMGNSAAGLWCVLCVCVCVCVLFILLFNVVLLNAPPPCAAPGCGA